MAEKNFVTALVAQNATETTKTQASTDGYTVPQGVSKLVEAGLQFVTPTIVPLGTDVAPVIPAYIHDCDIAVAPGSHLMFGVTFNAALTINPSWRVFGKLR